MQITEYVCDECGKKRSSDVNHWRTLMVSHNRKEFTCSLLWNWSAQPAGLTGIDEISDVCGQDCAVKVFSRWLSTGKLKAEVPNGKS